jgi:hypothetical protein
MHFACALKISKNLPSVGMKRPNMKIPKSNFPALNQLFTETHAIQVSAVRNLCSIPDQGESM